MGISMGATGAVPEPLQEKPVSATSPNPFEASLQPPLRQLLKAVRPPSPFLLRAAQPHYSQHPTMTRIRDEAGWLRNITAGGTGRL